MEKKYFSADIVTENIFSILTNEESDTSNKRQLSLVLHYVDSL